MNTYNFGSIKTLCGAVFFPCLTLAMVLVIIGCNNSNVTPVDQGDIAISASDVNFVGCKFLPGQGVIDSLPSNKSGIFYHYDGEAVLSIEHINAGFNCCPTDLAAEVNCSNDTITIVEVEDLSQDRCRCNCLFDLDYQLTGIAPGVYVVIIVEPYIEEGEARLEFTVDLISSPNGSFVVDRTHHPWGG